MRERERNWKRFSKPGATRARLQVSREARIPGRGMRVRRKRGEQLLSCQRRPLNLPANLFTIVPWPGSADPTHPYLSLSLSRSIPSSCVPCASPLLPRPPPPPDRIRRVILLPSPCDDPSRFHSAASKMGRSKWFERSRKRRFGIERYRETGPYCISIDS